MRWFAKWLASAWFTTTIDYSKYLKQEQVDSKWTLKYLLAEKLASEWVSLPSQVTSANIKANSAKERVNQNARENYKKEIDKKYGNSLKKLSDEKLQTIDSKLDKAIEKAENNTWIVDKIKEKTLNIYYALKDYIAWLFR
jgi:primosomal protein N''